MRILTPVTIWRFLLGQLLKLLALTALILVAVLSFVGAVRLFANGTLGVIETLQLAGWLTIPMLQYALPFAGGFAATLAYHRMSQDNELTACYAGGIAHRTVLLPTLALGLLMGGAMFAMADQVMPRFLRAAQEMITSDPSRLLAGRLGKGQSLTLDRGRKLLYADDVSEVAPEPGGAAFKHLVMRGVVALELDDKGGVERELSSPVANVWLYREADAPAAPRAGGEERWAVPGEGSTVAVMQLRDPVGGPVNRALAYVEQTVVSYRLPSTFRDRAKFLSWAELERAWMNPQRLTAVEDRRKALAQMLAERTAIDGLRQELRTMGRATLIDGARRPVVLRAAGIEASPTGERGFAIVPATPGAPIEATVVGALGGADEGAGTGGAGGHVHRAVRAYIGQPTAAAGSGTSLTLSMEEVSTRAVGGAGRREDDGAAGVLTALSLQGLRPAGDPLAGYMEASPDTLARHVEQRLATHADAPLAAQGAALAKEIGTTRREIRAKQHERVATSLSCVAMVLLGAVMGMRLGTAPPLSVYMWSFLPSLGAMVAISGGVTMAVQQGPAGLLLLYGGVAAVAALTLVHYRVLTRH